MILIHEPDKILLLLYVQIPPQHSGHLYSISSVTLANPAKLS